MPFRSLLVPTLPRGNAADAERHVHIPTETVGTSSLLELMSRTHNLNIESTTQELAHTNEEHMDGLRKASSIAFLLLFLQPTGSTLAQSRADLPNDLTLELLGRCLVYSFSYQRIVSPNLGIEGGLSILGGSAASVVFISGGGRVYLSPRDAAPCISGGFVAVTASTGAGPFSSDASTAYLYAGPGFEYRSSGGFVFRGSVYFLIRDGFFVWPGVQVGIAF